VSLKIQHKCGLSKTLLLPTRINAFDECKSGKESSKNRRADKIKNRQNRSSISNAANIYPRRLIQALMLYCVREMPSSNLGWDTNYPNEFFHASAQFFHKMLR
jgi:hypothetical protein